MLVMEELYFSWSGYYQQIERLAVKIYESGWEFNQIVCIAKGGLRVGDVLCRLFRRPLAILSASSYTGPDNRVRGSIKFSSHLTMTADHLGDRVLLVDDLVDSGVSLQEGINWLQCHYPADIQEIKTAVLWYKACSAIAPNYYVDYLPDSPWIHQPFEFYERTTPAELAAKYEEL